jgi:hypothetical protein
MERSFGNKELLKFLDALICHIPRVGFISKKVTDFVMFTALESSSLISHPSGYYNKKNFIRMECNTNNSC